MNNLRHGSPTAYCECSNCDNCGKEPYNGNRDKRACYAAEERHKKHIEKYGESPDSYWMAPQPWVPVGARFYNGCEFFIGE